MSNRKDKDGRVLPKGVSQRKDGRYIYRKKLETGKMFYLYSTDLTELKKMIREAEADEVRGLDIDGSKMDLDTFYELYVETYKQDKVRASTLQNVKGYYIRHIKGSALGRTKLKDIKRIELVRHYKRLQAEKSLSYRTIEGLNSMLYNALQEAVYNHLIFSNPCDGIMKEIPKGEIEQREALSRDESRVLIEYLELDTRYHMYLPIVKLMLLTGLRWGEIAGLTWEDVVEDCYISVNHAISYRNRGNGCHEYYIDKPKTVNGIREIPITEEMQEMFNLQRQFQHDMKVKNDLEIDGYKNFVFATMSGQGYPYTNEAICKALRCIVKSANQWEAERAKEEEREPVVIDKITPHKLRHTFSTRLAEADVSPAVHKKLMGHSRVETSYNVYCHLGNSKLEQTMNELVGKLV